MGSSSSYCNKDLPTRVGDFSYNGLSINNRIRIKCEVQGGLGYDNNNFKIKLQNNLFGLSPDQNREVANLCILSDDFYKNFMSTYGCFVFKSNQSLSEIYNYTKRVSAINKSVLFPLNMVVDIFQDRIVYECFHKFNNEPSVYIVRHTPIPSVCWTTRLELSIYLAYTGVSVIDVQVI